MLPGALAPRRLIVSRSEFASFRLGPALGPMAATDQDEDALIMQDSGFIFFDTLAGFFARGHIFESNICETTPCLHVMASQRDALCVRPGFWTSGRALG